jgi:hypothetical protein
MNHKKAIGEHCGAPGYGSKIEGKVLVPNEAEAKVARLICSYLEAGRTLQFVADRLNDDGIPTKE